MQNSGAGGAGRAALETCGVLLRGVGLDMIYPNLLALTAFTLVIVGASVWRFRKQLS